MNVTLTPQSEAVVRQWVDTGRFPDAASVVDAAIRLLEENERLEIVRSLVDDADAAVARGEVVDWTSGSLERLKIQAAEAVRTGVSIPDHVKP